MPLSDSRKVSTKNLAKDPALAGCSPGVKYLWRVYVQSAMRRGIPMEITPEQFKIFIEGLCAYCGSPPMNRTKVKWEHNIAYNGIDRVDQGKPYRIGNLVSCCKTCNSMKSRLPASTFLEHVKKIFRQQTLGRATT